MKAATISELKKELSVLDTGRLVQLCLRLAKHKVENKELLTYLLYEATDEDRFVNSVKIAIAEQFQTINRANTYWTRKGLRRILRFMDKYIRYSGNKETEVELRIHFCTMIRNESIPVHQSKVLANLYDRQILKIRKAMLLLHEDLQADYAADVIELQEL